jgi:peptidoglycan hydrolase-like protein with peptidoglycan-binding domain
MVLRFGPFAADTRMVAASQSAPPLRLGHHGSAVRLLQAGLIQVGFPLPISTRASGVPDAWYGAETRAAVSAFQRRSGLGDDGTTGRDTIRALDALLAAATPPPPPIPPPPPSTQTADYMLGSGDPPLAHDPGAGAWKSVPEQMTYAALRASILAQLPISGMIIGDDAAKLMRHYLENSGRPYTIDLEAMVRDVPSAKDRYLDELDQMKSFVELLPPGRHDFKSRQAQVGYNRQSESRNWYFAIGGYSTWGSGTAEVTDTPAGRTFEVTFTYSFYDRYNWDGGKSVSFATVTVTDEFMGKFHRQGLAREFNCVGTFQRRFDWAQGQSFPMP